MDTHYAGRREHSCQDFKSQSHLYSGFKRSRAKVPTILVNACETQAQNLTMRSYKIIIENRIFLNQGIKSILDLALTNANANTVN